MKNCPNCGGQNQDDARFCTNCGTALEQSNSPGASGLADDAQGQSENSQGQYSGWQQNSSDPQGQYGGWQQNAGQQQAEDVEFEEVK